MSATEPHTPTVWNATVTVQPALGGKWDGVATWSNGWRIELYMLNGKTEEEALRDARMALAAVLPDMAPIMSEE